MPPFDRLLLNPGRPQIAAALAEAARELGCGAWPPANLDSVLLRCMGEAHGNGGWKDSNYRREGIALSWASAALGPRLVRVWTFAAGEDPPAQTGNLQATWPAWAVV